MYKNCCLENVHRVLLPFIVNCSKKNICKVLYILCCEHFSLRTIKINILFAKYKYQKTEQLWNICQTFLFVSIWPKLDPFDGIQNFLCVHDLKKKLLKKKKP